MEGELLDLAVVRRFWRKLLKSARFELSRSSLSRIRFVNSP